MRCLALKFLHHGIPIAQFVVFTERYQARIIDVSYGPWSTHPAR